MEPAYSEGDWLLVESISGGPPVGRGEVVLARRGDRLVSHRVVALEEGIILTKGDACTAADPPIQTEALIGRVVGARRGTGLRSRLRRARRILLRYFA